MTSVHRVPKNPSDEVVVMDRFSPPLPGWGASLTLLLTIVAGCSHPTSPGEISTAYVLMESPCAFPLDVSQIQPGIGTLTILAAAWSDSPPRPLMGHFDDSGAFVAADQSQCKPGTIEQKQFPYTLAKIGNNGTWIRERPLPRIGDVLGITIMPDGRDIVAWSGQPGAWVALDWTEPNGPLAFGLSIQGALRDTFATAGPDGYVVTLVAQGPLLVRDAQGREQQQDFRAHMPDATEAAVALHVSREGEITLSQEIAFGDKPFALQQFGYLGDHGGAALYGMAVASGTTIVGGAQTKTESDAVYLIQVVDGQAATLAHFEDIGSTAIFATGPADSITPDRIIVQGRLLADEASIVNGNQRRIIQGAFGAPVWASFDTDGTIQWARAMKLERTPTETVARLPTYVAQWGHTGQLVGTYGLQDGTARMGIYGADGALQRTYHVPAVFESVWISPDNETLLAKATLFQEPFEGQRNPTAVAVVFSLTLDSLPVS